MKFFLLPQLSIPFTAHVQCNKMNGFVCGISQHDTKINFQEEWACSQSPNSICHHLFQFIIQTLLLGQKIALNLVLSQPQNSFCPLGKEKPQAVPYAVCRNDDSCLHNSLVVSICSHLHMNRLVGIIVDLIKSQYRSPEPKHVGYVGIKPARKAQVASY